MTVLALLAVVLAGFSIYYLACAFADIPTSRTSRTMLMVRKQQGGRNEKLAEVYPVSYTHLDVYKRQP